MKLFAKFLTISSLLFLQISCNIEDDQHEDHKHDYSKTNIKRITIKDAVVNTNAFNKLTKPNKQIKNINGRVINDTINNFSIETESGTYIEKENYHSYTFKVIRENGSEFLLENIVVDKYNDSDYRTFLYQYDITQDELNLINNNQYVDLNNKISIIVLENSSISDYLNTNSKIDYNSMCYVSNTYYVEGSFICPENGHNYSNYTSCPYFDDGTASPTHGNWATDVSLTPCVDTGGFNNTDAGNESPSGENGGSGTGGSSTTTPTTTNYQKLREKCFTENNPEVSSWLNQPENADIKNDVREYLENSVNHDGLQSTETCYPQENIENIENFKQDIIDSGLDLDFELSINSPANIDITYIEDASEDAKRILNCALDKLKKSNNFKNLYDSTFGGNDNRINLKIEIGNLPSGVGGQTHAQYNGVSGQVTNLVNTITISRDRILNTSTIYLANLIVHEMIHAYLNIQRANLGTDIYNLNNYDTLGDFLVSNQPISANNNNVDTHTFMFQNMIPVFVNIYNEILSELVNQNEINFSIGTELSNPTTGEVYEAWSVQNFLYYLSTHGLDKSHDGTITNQAYMNEIGNFPNKSIPRDFYYIRDAMNSFTKKCI
jgi:hypothetical protein